MKRIIVTVLIVLFLLVGAAAIGYSAAPTLQAGAGPQQIVIDSNGEPVPSLAATKIPVELDDTVTGKAINNQIDNAQTLIDGVVPEAVRGSCIINDEWLGEGRKLERTYACEDGTGNAGKSFEEWSIEIDINDALLNDIESRGDPIPASLSHTTVYRLYTIAGHSGSSLRHTTSNPSMCNGYTYTINNLNVYGWGNVVSSVLPSNLGGCDTTQIWANINKGGSTYVCTSSNCSNLANVGIDNTAESDQGS